jgi:hypothetical protein
VAPAPDDDIELWRTDITRCTCVVVRPDHIEIRLFGADRLLDRAVFSNGHDAAHYAINKMQIYVASENDDASTDVYAGPERRTPRRRTASC